jgi:hypothetical protein
MYKAGVVFLVVATGAFAHAHMSGMGNWGMNMNAMNGMGWGNGMGQMGQQMGQMNILQQLLGMGMNNGMHGMNGFNGMNGMNMNGMNGMTGGRGGMMNTIMGMLLQAMMQNMGGHHGKDDDDDHDDMSREDMKRLEGYMKMEFAMEVAHIAVVYKEYKDAMEAFKEMVDNLCLGVEAAYEHGRRYNETENATLSDAADRAGESIDQLDTRQKKIDALVELIQNDEEVFGLGFFKIATLVCTTGETYMKAYEKMEALEKGGDCQACDQH